MTEPDESDVEYIDRETALAAVIAGVGHGPRLVHCRTELGSPSGVFWDADGVLDYIDHSEARAWVDGCDGHDLAAKQHGDRWRYFAVRRPPHAPSAARGAAVGGRGPAMLTTDETFEQWLRRCKVQDALAREHMLTPAEALASYDALVEVGAFGWRA